MPSNDLKYISILTKDANQSVPLLLLLLLPSPAGFYSTLRSWTSWRTLVTTPYARCLLNQSIHKQIGEKEKKKRTKQSGVVDDIYIYRHSVMDLFSFSVIENMKDNSQKKTTSTTLVCSRLYFIDAFLHVGSPHCSTCKRFFNPEAYSISANRSQYIHNIHIVPVVLVTAP